MDSVATHHGLSLDVHIVTLQQCATASHSSETTSHLLDVQMTLGVVEISFVIISQSNDTSSNEPIV